MPVTNTNELAAQVKDWLNRDDLDSVLETFIKAADIRILSDSRSRGEMTQQIIVLDRNEPLEMVNPVPISTKYYPAWGGFYADGLDTAVDTQPEQEQLTEDTYDYEYLNVYINDQEYYRVTIDEFYQDSRGSPERVYTVVGGRLFIDGFPDVDPTFTSAPQPEQEAYVMKLVVFQKPEIDFTADEPTSELLRSIPMAYLYASLTEAAVYLRDMEATTLYQSRYDEFMTNLYKDYKRKQVSTGWAVKSVGGDKLFNTRRA